MNVKINGDIITVVSNLNYEALKKCAPVYLKNEEGKNVYGVNVNSIGTVTAVGASFTYANAEGKAALNLAIPPMSTDKAKDYVLDSIGAELASLKENEPKLVEEINARLAAREALAETIAIG